MQIILLLFSTKVLQWSCQQHNNSSIIIINWTIAALNVKNIHSEIISGPIRELSL